MKVAGMVVGAILTAVLLCGCDQKATVVTKPVNIWLADYDAALKQAVAENKYVLVSISGLEWCSWCKTLESEVFSKPEFIDYAKDNLICVLLDFDFSQRATNQQFATRHEALLAKFQVEGFPTVMILNPKEKEIKRDGYQRGGAVNYVEFIKGVIAADSTK